MNIQDIYILSEHLSPYMPDDHINIVHEYIYTGDLQRHRTLLNKVKKQLIQKYKNSMDIVNETLSRNDPYIIEVRLDARNITKIYLCWYKFILDRWPPMTNK